MTIRSEDVHLRVTGENKKEMEAEAEKLGLSVSALIRLMFRWWVGGMSLKKEDADVESNEGGESKMSEVSGKAVPGVGNGVRKG